MTNFVDLEMVKRCEKFYGGDGQNPHPCTLPAGHVGSCGSADMGVRYPHKFNGKEVCEGCHCTPTHPIHVK